MIMYGSVLPSYDDNKESETSTVQEQKLGSNEFMSKMKSLLR